VTLAKNIKLGPGLSKLEVQNETHFSVLADSRYAGKTSLSFEVTDGAGVEDARGLLSTLNLPVTVTSSGLHQPVLRPSEVTVAPGEPAAATDLKAMVTDADPGDLEKLRFSVVDGTSEGGFKSSIKDASILVAAPAALRTGTSGSVVIRVSDGSSKPVEMKLPLRVIASTRPPIQTTDAEVKDARSGQVSTIDLTSYITNPFADRGGKVTLLTTPRIAPERGTVSVDGLKVSITPAADFDGQLVITYTAQDATQDASRNRPGTIRVTVKGKPRPPIDVTAVTKASRSATVSWTAGELRGGSLKGFTVSWSGGTKACGRQTICEIAGQLKNDVEYQFTVSEETEVGVSTASAPSNSVRPDVKPNPPSTPTASFGDAEIDLAWTDGGGDGSKTVSYTVEVRPAVNGKTQVAGVTGTSYTMTGLANGTPYSFRIRAHNKAPDPSEFSGLSRPEVPAGAPDGAAKPRVDKDPVSSSLPRATVSWAKPDDPNGDSDFAYELRRTGDTKVLYAGSNRSATVSLSVSTQGQTFEVRATNKSRKWSEWSDPSDAVRGFQKPGAPTNLSVKATGDSNTVRFTFGSADGNGARDSEIRYVWTAGGSSGEVTSGATVSNGAFTNGDSVTVRLQAISKVDGEQAEGPTANDAVTAFGPPTAPNISCVGGYRKVSCSWSGGSGNGRTPSYRLSDAANGAVESPGDRAFDGIGFGENRRLCVTASQADSSRETTACADATAWSAPTDNWENSGQAAKNGTVYARLVLSRWRPNSSVFCRVISDTATLPDWTGTVPVDGNGSYSGVPNSAIGKPQAPPRYFPDPAFGDCEQR